MTIKKQQTVKILNNKRISGRYFKLSFNSPWPVKDVKPGQFIEVKVTDDMEPFLRKPLSFHATRHPGVIEILYEVIGKGTEILSRRRAGESLDVIGPLGNGFSLEGSRVKGQGSRVLVAGGIGVAPLVLLAEKLVHSPQSTVHGKILVLIGGKTKDDVLCEKDFKDLGCEIKIATDDGSAGYKGFVSGLLKSFLSTSDQRPATIYACGPKPMLREAAQIAKENKIPCQVLLEEYMACGVGVCLGCAVRVKPQYAIRNTQYEYKMVCKDGPVFTASEVIWE